MVIHIDLTESSWDKFSKEKQRAKVSHLPKRLINVEGF